MKAKRYIGEVVNGYVLTSLFRTEHSTAWFCKCATCGTEYNYARYLTGKPCTECQKAVRFSGSTAPEKTDEEIARIKEKYKNGVTKEILEEFIDHFIK